MCEEYALNYISWYCCVDADQIVYVARCRVGALSQLQPVGVVRVFSRGYHVLLLLDLVDVGVCVVYVFPFMFGGANCNVYGMLCRVHSMTSALRLGDVVGMTQLRCNVLLLLGLCRR